MNMLVERTCTELGRNGADSPEAESRPLSAYRSTQAYVLLGDPGSGKTTSLRAECEEFGDQAKFLSARDFLVYEPAPEELRGRALFIDGLDEVLAGTSDVRSPFDRIRRLLIKLGRPRFRISCREADWLGENDRQRFELVAKDSTVTALRLDPLTPTDVKTILRCSFAVNDPSGFVEQARERGVDGLLANPQSLELLTKAVDQGKDWPESRFETFELACVQMAGECNAEHRHAKRPGIPIDSLIDFAGRLCALQLVADLIGYSLDEDSETPDYPRLDVCVQGDSHELREALSSKLFKADGDQRFSPVHRQIAEFLGARHLAGLIDKGLSSGRVMALITGGDGTVVTALRGLSAWLAAHSPQIRTKLVSNDAFGVAIYGDIQDFSPDEKQKLLAALLRQPGISKRATLNIKAFAPLVAAETEPLIRQVLGSAGRGLPQQERAAFILLILSRGKQRAVLAPQMLRIVRDDSWSPPVRQAALEGFIRNRKGSLARTEELLALLEDIRASGVTASNQDIFGILLGELYPDVVRPGNVWDYLTEAAGYDMADRYWQFWERTLLAKASDGDIPDLLDSLAPRISNLEPAFDSIHRSELPVVLLERGLRLHGDRVAWGRVYQWLGAGAQVLDRFRGHPPEAVLQIRAWLEHRPEIQLDVVLRGLNSCRDDHQVHYADFMNRKRLFEARLPADFGLWCLKQAVAFAKSKPQVAMHLFQEAYREYKTAESGNGLSGEVLRKHAQQHECLIKLLTNLEAPPPPTQEEAEWKRRRAKMLKEHERKRHEWREWVRSKERALLENRAVPALLHQLALVYFGKHPDLEKNCRGKDALVRILGGPGAVKAPMHGLRGVFDRDDLPSVREIVRFAKKQRMHYLGLPLLAALEERESSSPRFLHGEADSRVRACVACYHNWAPDLSGSSNGRPAWYEGLLDSDPGIVLEVAVQCAAAAVRADGFVSQKFWDIADNNTHGAVARAAMLDLLRIFPTRCSLRHLGTLDDLLWGAIGCGAEAELLDLAKRKLSKTGMNAGQRVRWLGAGLICSSGTFREPIVEFLGGKERLIRHLAMFCVHGADPFGPDRGSKNFPYESLGNKTLETIIRTLGRCFSPCDLRGFGYISDEIRVSMFLTGITNNLASKPDKSATEALTSLLDDVALDRWHKHLSQARDSQRIIRRDAEYRHPTLKQAFRVLQGGPPANPGDLAVLTVGRLRNIGTGIRTKNTNQWRLFWNEAGHGKPGEPKVENSCRDALLALLQPHLPHPMNAQPEGQHASQTRSDILVSANGFQVPIEVKGNTDRELWSALQKQLIAKYAVDPASDGYGIYVVLWFDGDKQRRRSDGVRPNSPEELERLLRGSLSPDERRKISICVVDVSPPDSEPVDQQPQASVGFQRTRQAPLEG